MSITEETTTTKPSLEQEVAAWSKTDADLHALVKATEGVTIAGHVAGEKKGREVVHQNLMKLVRAKTSIQDRKAELKRPALDLCNLIETEAKRLLAIPAAREAELRKERDDWDAAQAKIEADRLESRVNAMTAAGIPVDLVRASDLSDLSDEDWADYLAKALDAKAKLDAATKLADELTALGDECTPGEALHLTDDQIEHRLGVARKADHDRKEAKRIADEEAAAQALRIETERQRAAAEEKVARERLERGYRRGRELALLGAVGHEVEPLADMTEEAYQVAIETARQEKADRDAKIAEERRIQEEKDAELARLKQAEADRLERERLALEAREREAKEAADKAEADAKAAREEAAREVRHHGAPSFAIDPIAPAVVDAVQAVEPQEIEEALAVPDASWSVQVTTWFSGIRAAIEASPDKNADTLAAVTKMLNAVKEVEDELLPF